MARWLSAAVLGVLLSACGRSGLDDDDGGTAVAGSAGSPWPWWHVDAGARPDASAPAEAPDASADPDDLPWEGDTRPFDPARVDCLDVDAGLACGILTGKQLEAICASGRPGYDAFEADRLAMEGLGTLVADVVTVARVRRELAALRQRFPAVDAASVFVYTIPEAGPWFMPEEYALVRLGAHDAFNCLLLSLRAHVTRSWDPGAWVALAWEPELNPFVVTQLFLEYTDAYTFRWSSAPYHPCTSDICLSIVGSRFSYVIKSGDCRAPSYETYTVGLDAGVTVQPGWDRARHPSCGFWFDQVKWR